MDLQLDILFFQRAARNNIELSAVTNVGSNEHLKNYPTQAEYSLIIQPSPLQKKEYSGVTTAAAEKQLTILYFIVHICIQTLDLKP